MKEKILQIMAEVMDPEIPVLSIVDLGILRDVHFVDHHIEIVITPTYSACPAMDAIRDDIRYQLKKNGYADISIRTVLSPAWTTEWMTESGKIKLKKYGIAPPVRKQDCRSALLTDQAVECPQCHSSDTVMLSEFGSTACKAMFRCNQCLETFDYFKCH